MAAAHPGKAFKDEGNQLFKKKDYEGAIAKYSLAIEAEPSNNVYYSNRSAAFLALGNYAAATHDGYSAIRIDKYWVKGYFRAATAQKAAGEYVAALKTIDDGLKTNGDHSDLTRLRAEVAPLAEAAQKAAFDEMSPAAKLKYAGNQFFKAAQFDQAIQKYTEALAAEPCDPTSLSKLAIDCHNNRAACYQQLGSHKMCAEDCSAVLETDPRNLKALLRRGLALEALERYRLALDDIRAVILIDPTIAVANAAQHRLGENVRRLKAAKARC